MLSRIYKFLVLFIIVSVALYLVLMNRETITFALSPNVKVSGNAGAVFLSIFALGVICTGLVGLWFGLKSFLRERRLINRDRERKEFYQQMLHARSLRSAGDLRAAIQVWQDALKHDPTDMIAKLELSECLEQQGELREALRVLEEARAGDSENIELLFRASALNVKLGNRTAAIDNLALVLSQRSSNKAAKMACALSEELERFDDALEYEARLSGMGQPEEDSSAIRARIEYKKIVLEHSALPKTLAPALKTFIKRNPTHAPALEFLAEHELAGGNTEEAVQFFIKAARVTKNAKIWARAARVWIDQKSPERALSSLRSATRELTGRPRLEAELELIRLYLTLNMLEDSRRAVDGFAEMAAEEKVKLDAALLIELDTLQAVQLQRSQNFSEALTILNRLSALEASDSSSGGRDKLAAGSGTRSSQPSPTLSTP